MDLSFPFLYREYGRDGSKLNYFSVRYGSGCEKKEEELLTIETFMFYRSLEILEKHFEFHQNVSNFQMAIRVVVSFSVNKQMVPMEHLYQARSS